MREMVRDRHTARQNIMKYGVAYPSPEMVQCWSKTGVPLKGQERYIWSDDGFGFGKDFERMSLRENVVSGCTLLFLLCIVVFSFVFSSESFFLFPLYMFSVMVFGAIILSLVDLLLPNRECE